MTKNFVIFKEGEPVNYIYFLLKGEYVVTKNIYYSKLNIKKRMRGNILDGKMPG